MRTKVVVIAIAGFVVILLFFVIYLTLPKEDTTKHEIALRSDIKDGYTLEDMMNGVKNEKINRSADLPAITKSESETEESIKRIQSFIQENEGDFQSPTTPKMSSDPTPPSSRKQRQPKKKTEGIESQESNPKRKRRFNSIQLVREDESNAIRAFVHSTQTVMVGSTLKMQLAENCLTDDGQRIKKGTPVYGEVKAIDGERVIIKITSININNNILPFKKNVFSKDAIEGIYVPGNPKSDVAKDASASAVTGANTNITGGYDVGSQLVAGAANSVVNATKAATSKNIRKTKVTIKTNYQILLMEDKKP